MNTAYQSRPVAPTLSPYQRMRDDALDVHKEDHPVQREIRRLVRSYPLMIEVTEDLDTLRTMSNVKGMVAFMCSVKKDGQIIGQGRGSSVIGRMSKFVEKTVRVSFNAAIIAGVMHATRALDILADPYVSNMGIEEDVLPSFSDTSPSYSREQYPVREYAPAGISEKQKSFLLGLINKLRDKDEKNGWIQRMDGMSSHEASVAIQSLKG